VVVAGVAKVESNHAGGRRIAADGTLRDPIYGPRLTGSGVGGNTRYFPDTDRGRYDADTTTERAVGPLQFMPATWASNGQDGNGDGEKDPQNADDAALTAAVYLCGPGRDLRDAAQLRQAIYSYNRSSAYVAEVSGWIDRYREIGIEAATGTRATGTARTVIEAARSQLGVPYSWGGGNAAGPSTGKCCSPAGKSGVSIAGFDCSSLTLYAYGKAGVRLPRVASDQAGVGERIPPGAGMSALRPGDLVFFADVPGRDASIHHVGIYLGGGRMLNAPRPGTRVREDPVWQDGFAGGARVL
jgi:cell wall-associated NlpC family hydrolase